jgi:hypothetical protein
MKTRVYKGTQWIKRTERKKEKTARGGGGSGRRGRSLAGIMGSNPAGGSYVCVVSCTVNRK